MDSAARGPGHERASRPWGTTTDGKEVVAVWTPGVVYPFHFRLLESGATGALGDSFALIALMSAVKLWQPGYETADTPMREWL